LAKKSNAYIYGVIQQAMSRITLIVVFRRMRLLSVIFSCVILFQINVLGELSSSSCALIRTTNSLTTIVPEIAQLAMRYYRASSSMSNQNHRQKRFLFNDNMGKNGSSSSMRGSVVEQMIANAFRDVNFTNVAILILNNNETMNKIRKNIDSDAIIRIIMREVDYEKVGSGLWSAAENEFDLEHWIASIINITNIDVIHDELLTNDTLPEWLLKSIHPDFDVEIMQKIFSTLKNVTNKFVQVLSRAERYDNYLFNMITQQALTPLNNIIQGVKEDKPKTFDQLIEIILNNVNRVTMVREIYFSERIILIAVVFCHIRNNLQKEQQRKYPERNYRHQVLQL
jgi:hypothetical protein